MSIRKYLKEHCPSQLLILMLEIHRAYIRHNRRKSSRLTLKKAQQYLSYYQDELSREVLSSCLECIKTHDNNIFLDLAEKTGMKFYGLHGINREDYSGIVLLYDSKSGTDSWFRYMKRLLSLCGWSDKYRFMTLKEFLDGAQVSESELISTELTTNGEVKCNRFAAKRNLHVTGQLVSMREDLQYFDVFAPVDDEVVVDAGAYDGQTAVQFLNWGRGKVKHVYSFELDPENAAKCEENLKPYADKVTIINKGTWYRDEVIHIAASGGAGSSIAAEGDVEVSLTAIDNIVKDERVTFIKMDVEGAELKSLMGAKDTIINHHPRLAICAYHKSSDLYELPGYILSLVPEYKFYLRHYSSCGWETVLYAYCD